MKKSLRVLSVILSLVMVFSIVPMTVFADPTDADGKFTNSQLTVATEKNSTLAPGIAQDAYTVYDKNGDQVKMFITTADMSVDTVKLFTSYKDMDPTNYGMSKLTEQVDAFNAKAEAGDEYYQGTVVAGINASYYNMITGKPTGVFVMNGVDVTTESEGNAYGYFAVMKDGSVKIGNKGDYSSDKGNIQEAIGIYTMLIVDGKICSGLNTAQKYPRQTIGITADGNVILMTADGNQAPKSIGLTVQEQAQVMLDLGCVWAGHLDGGGSCTYAAKAEGSNDFRIENSPSDGSERSISNGFIMVSTAVSDGKFCSASLTAENEYVTPNSVVKVSATGVDKAGGPAEIPADADWQLADASFGSVADGVFTSTGKTGEAVVQMVYGGNVVGETVINVVVPETLTFNSAEMVVPYSKSVPLSLTATYNSRDVVIKPSDIKFTLSNSAVGTISGFTFTACEENAAVTASDITATLVYDESLTASSKITLGKGSEVVYNFEDGTSQNVIIDETPGTKYNYVWPESNQFIATAENGKVHSGSYALGSTINYANSLESGYMKSSIYATESKVFENAVGVGVWIYIPDEFVGLWARWTLRSVTFDADGNPVFGSAVNSNTMDTAAGGTGYVSTFDEPGWHYLYADTSAYSAVGWSANSAMIQLYISDRDGAAYNYKAADHSNIPSEYTIYIDDVTVDYSTAVDDREAPIVSNLTYATAGMADAAALTGQTVTSNVVTFAANVADYTGKANYTGVNAATAKAYIDGVEVESTYANGIISITDAKLTNGKHTIKFAASDNMGNYGCKYGYITVNAAESDSTVKLVAHDATADRIKLDSIYEMDLVATAIEEVKSVSVKIDLDNNSTWQLDHMILADGFEATYSVDKYENVATITITRTEDSAATGEAVLATLPVRVWTLKAGYTYPNGTKAGSAAMTLKNFRDGKEFWRMSVIAEVDMGVLTRVDNTTSTFTGERVFCDTEMWGNYAAMSATSDGLAYYNAWDGGHIHTAAAIADAAATCTKDGYTGRTFCSVCNSVVDWGTKVPATGHKYDFIDGVLSCTCGKLFSGVHTDGKTYVDGALIADGWVEDSYYKGGVKLTGLQKIGDYYYDFGDNGVCENKARLDGFYFDKSVNAYRYFVAGQMTIGEATIYPEVYFYDENGVAVSGKVDILGYTCYFDEKGAFVDSDDDSVVDAGFSGANIQYVLLSNGLLKVDGEGVMKDYSSNGLYPAWVIQNDATAIRALEVGNGITKIGRFGFYKNVYMNSVTFEENSSLHTISWGAFGHNWRLLGNVEIPASVEVIEGYAFYECGALESVTFEEGSKLKTIGQAAFYHDIALKSVYIPEDVVTMEGAIFKTANADVVLKVAENSVGHMYAQQNNHKFELRAGTVKVIKSGSLNADITWELYSDGTLAINGTGAMPNFASHTAQPWYSFNNMIKKIVIGKDITTVGNYAFSYAQNVAAVEFEAGSKLNTIGVLSFFNNPKLTSIVLPETVKNINSYAFGDCFALESVYVPQGTGFIYKTAFTNSDNVVLNVAEGVYAHEFAVANGVKYEIREFVYTPVASGKLSDTVEWARYENGELWITGTGAMPNFTSHKDQPWYTTNNLIKKIVIGKDITTVGNYAFCYAQNVTAVEFEEGSKVKSIGVLSFFNNPKLKSIVLPETVASISAYAFGDCFALESVYVPQATGFIYKTAFVNSDKVVLNVAEGVYAHEFAVANGVKYETREFVYIPVASGKLSDTVEWARYENGELWITGTGAMPNFASHNQQPWYTTNNLIKKIVIGKDITTVGNYAFCYAQNVTEVEFEEGSKLKSIGVLSFFNNPKLKSVVLPETVTSISAYAFGDCFALESVYVPQATGFIYKTAFANSDKVVLNVAEGVYSHEFAVANGIKYELREFVYAPVASGKLSDTVEWARYENGELWITGTGAMPNFASHKDQPWYTTNNLVKKIVIGKDITAVGNYAFCYAQNVTEVEFEEGSKIKSIGVLSFYNMPKLKSIVLPETVTAISTYAFGDCFALESVVVPAGVTSIHKTAFSNSSKVVLEVEAGSYAETFASSNGVAYKTK